MSNESPDARPRGRAISFAAADTDDAHSARERLSARYGNAPLERTDVIVVLGGDGAMLETLHKFIDQDVPIFGMNCGSIGFLLNEFREHDLEGRLAAAQPVILHPLCMVAHTLSGETHRALAINEVSILRETRQAAKLRISVDGVTRLPELICDGALVSTAAGSTAYNLSVFGPILPLSANLLTLMPISAFRPRRWRGALLPCSARIRFDILEGRKRPISAVADYTEVRDVTWVEIREDRSISLRLLFDPEHNLEERIIKEQFMP